MKTQNDKIDTLDSLVLLMKFMGFMVYELNIMLTRVALLQGMSEHTALAVLGVGSNPLRDEGARHLASLMATLPALTTLSAPHIQVLEFRSLPRSLCLKNTAQLQLGL